MRNAASMLAIPDPGVICESLAEVQKSLDRHRREREESKGCYHSRFDSSPRLTTLISTLMGPLFILLLSQNISPANV